MLPMEGLVPHLFCLVLPLLDVCWIHENKRSTIIINQTRRCHLKRNAW